MSKVINLTVKTAYYEKKDVKFIDYCYNTEWVTDSCCDKCSNEFDKDEEIVVARSKYNGVFYFHKECWNES